MPLSVNFLPEAWEQFQNQVNYLTIHASLKLAHRYVDALCASLELLAEMPEMGAKVTVRRHHLTGIRRWHVKRPFQKYLIYYRVRGQFLDVLHVVHGAQDIDAIL